MNSRRLCHLKIFFSRAELYLIIIILSQESLPGGGVRCGGEDPEDDTRLVRTGRTPTLSWCRWVRPWRPSGSPSRRRSRRKLARLQRGNTLRLQRRKSLKPMGPLEDDYPELAFYRQINNDQCSINPSYKLPVVRPGHYFVSILCSLPCQPFMAFI